MLELTRVMEFETMILTKSDIELRDQSLPKCWLDSEPNLIR
jgi:hypothetical protein